MMFDLHTHSVRNNAIVNGSVDVPVSSNVWFSLGVHPWFIPMGWRKLLIAIEKEKNLLAIGECGLDKLHETSWELQKEVFLAQISLAVRLQKPLIIHCVKAYNECGLFLKSINVFAVFHGFNKKEAVLLQLLKNDRFYVLGF